MTIERLYFAFLAAANFDRYLNKKVIPYTVSIAWGTSVQTSRSEVDLHAPNTHTSSLPSSHSQMSSQAFPRPLLRPLWVRQNEGSIDKAKDEKMLFETAMFGGQEDAAGEIVRADPLMVDRDLVNGEAMKGKVVVVGRGVLPFVEKARRVQAAGAICMVVINSADELYKFAGQGEDIKIPVVCVKHSDGALLVDGSAVRLKGVRNGGGTLCCTRQVAPNVAAKPAASGPGGIGLLRQPFLEIANAKLSDFEKTTALLPKLKKGMSPDILDCSRGEGLQGSCAFGATGCEEGFSGESGGDAAGEDEGWVLVEAEQKEKGEAGVVCVGALCNADLFFNSPPDRQQLISKLQKPPPSVGHDMSTCSASQKHEDEDVGLVNDHGQDTRSHQVVRDSRREYQRGRLRLANFCAWRTSTSTPPCRCCVVDDEASGSSVRDGHAAGNNNYIHFADDFAYSMPLSLNAGGSAFTMENCTFQNTPLQDVEKLTDVPGVGPKSAERLEDANVFIPVQLIGTFMVRIFLTVLSSASVSVRTRLHSNIHLSTLPGVRL